MKTAANPPAAAKNFHGRTLDLLGEAIVAGRHAPGSTMPPEPTLCEAFGVSRTVVREVIKSLVAKGLVSTGPKVGTRVLPPEQWNWFDPDVVGWQAKTGLTRAFVRELQELRLLVEPAAARLAAERATAKDRAALLAAYQGMAEAVAHGGDYVTHDLVFHQSLLRACGNRLMVQMGKALSALLRTSFELGVSVHGGAADSLPRHRAILDAVLAQDPARAERATLALIESARQDIERLMTSKRRVPSQRAPAPPLKPAPATKRAARAR